MDQYITYHSLFDAFPEPVFLIAGTRALYLNASARRLFRDAEQKPGDPLPEPLSALVAEQSGPFSVAGVELEGCTYSVTGTEQPEGILLVLRRESRLAVLSNPFLSTLSDRLRTPLNALLAAASMLAPAAEGNPQYETYLSVINQYHYRLLRIVGNLGAVSRLSQSDGDIPDEARNIDVIPLVRRLCDAADDLARISGRHVLFEPDREQLITAVDADLFTRMLLHLISNALKFSPENAAVSVRLSRKDNRFILSVQDKGPGLDKSELAIAFSHYESDIASSGPPSGIGLGLALVRQIAERHGGSVLLESRAGEGTTVTVALPLRRLEDDTLCAYRPPVDTYGGFDQTLVLLSDALPSKAFLPKDLE